MSSRLEKLDSATQGSPRAVDSTRISRPLAGANSEVPPESRGAALSSTKRFARNHFPRDANQTQPAVRRSSRSNRWARERRPLVAPALVFTACIVMAAAVTVATRLFGAPTAVTVAAPALAAVVMTRVPPAAAREHLAKVLALLAAGWIGGAAGLFIIDPAISAPFRRDVDPNGDRERRDALAVGGATIDRNGVLVDSDNAPAVVLGRHRARGLVGPLDEAFALTLLLGRIQAPFVAVPDPQSITGMNDQLNIAFPGLYREGVPGYHLIYQNNTWRLFARLSPNGVYGH